MNNSKVDLTVGIPVLITSAINVSAGQTLLTDAQIRLRLTLKSIEMWRATPMVSNVVVCDGSGFDIGQCIKNKSKSVSMAGCEVITFVNNLSKVETSGKGFGEGEIVNYAIKHSEVLKDCVVFAKCTGKLWVDNFGDCLKRFDGLAAFDYFGIFNPLLIDTRFYIVKKSFFNEKLAELHNDVSDFDGYYLEHAFRDGLKLSKLSSYAMYPTPRIRGVSGSLGIVYKNQCIRMLLRNIRTLAIRLFGL